MATRPLLAVSAALLALAGATVVASSESPAPTQALADENGDIDPFPFGACISASRLDHPVCVFIDPGQG